MAILFFVLSLDLKLKRLIKILSFPYLVINKIINILNKNKKNETNDDNFDSYNDIKNLSNDNLKETQPILPFAVNKQSKVYSDNFKLPSINFLEKNEDLKRSKIGNKIELNKNSEFLEKILLDFGVSGKIKRISVGPVVTLNEFEPSSGIKVSKIVNLADDIARNTSSISARVATIPGKSTIGIEIPNLKRENVFLHEIISNERFSKNEIKLPIALGKDISGIPIVGDLSAMPHLLIAGTTGSGKSVCINTIILSLLYKYSPEKCNLILIDPKM